MNERNDADDANMQRAIEMLQNDLGYDKKTATKIAWHLGSDAQFEAMLGELLLNTLVGEDTTNVVLQIQTRLEEIVAMHEADNL